MGIARHDGAFGFKAVKNVARVLPASALKGARKPPRTIKVIPVTVETVTADVEAQVAVPYPLTASFVPEQKSHRPLIAGLQVQNVDDDDRQRQAGHLGASLMTNGTLGCFVQLGDGTSALLSNNHVLAGENRGRARPHPPTRRLDSCRRAEGRHADGLRPPPAESEQRPSGPR